jgi:hypothetical protein
LIILFSFGPQLCESNILKNVMAENPGAKQLSNRPHNKPSRSALAPFLLFCPEENFVSAGMNGLITDLTQYCDVGIIKKRVGETIIVLK